MDQPEAEPVSQEEKDIKSKEGNAIHNQIIYIEKYQCIVADTYALLPVVVMMIN